MKLLQRTIRSYFTWSALLLVIMLPVFYLAVQHLVLKGVDRDLQSTKTMLKPRIADAILNNTLEQIRFADRNVTVSVAAFSRPYDSLYTLDVFDSATGASIPHRILTSSFTINGQPCVLQVKTSLLENFALIKDIVSAGLILLLLLLAGLLLINQRLTKKILDPFYQTLHKLRNYKIEEDKTLNLPASTITEFNDLNDAIKTLTTGAHQHFVAQKEFTENASHEMQSPLAVLQSHLEMLMQTSPLNEEQAFLITGMADASQRMNRLNRSLLLLAKIDNFQFSHIEHISLSKILNASVQQYQSGIAGKNLSVSTRINDDIILSADKTLIETLISNLFSNAIRHNVSNGLIEIETSNEQLTIRNTGEVTSLNEEKIFHRFHKQSGDASSIGLGLAITKKICNLYHYHISYHFDNNLHTFTIRFNNP
jgi:signal transduction histidine kinase